MTVAYLVYTYITMEHLAAQLTPCGISTAIVFQTPLTPCKAANAKH